MTGREGLCVHVCVCDYIFLWEGDRGERGDTKEAGMQWVNLLRSALPSEQRGKSGRWRAHKGWQGGRGDGAPFPNHLGLLFQK